MPKAKDSSGGKKDKAKEEEEFVNTTPIGEKKGVYLCCRFYVHVSLRVPPARCVWSYASGL